MLGVGTSHLKRKSEGLAGSHDRKSCVVQREFGPEGLCSLPGGGSHLC